MVDINNILKIREHLRSLSNYYTSEYNGNGLSTRYTGPRIEIVTNVNIQNRFDKSKYPIGAVFEVTELGYGVDVLGRPSIDTKHVIRIGADKLTNNPGYGDLHTYIDLKDLDIPFVNLSSPNQPRVLTISVYLEFPTFITNKVSYGTEENPILYDGFHYWWWLKYNELEDKHYPVSDDWVSSILKYRECPYMTQNIVTTKEEAVSLEYDNSPRSVVVYDPYIKALGDRSDIEVYADSLSDAMRKNRSDSYLKVYIYTADKQYIGSYIKEYAGSTWGDAGWYNGRVKLDMPAEMVSRLKYDTEYFYYVTFYNKVIGEVGYTKDLISFRTDRVYGLKQTLSATPHVKSEVGIYADLTINTSVKPTYALTDEVFSSDNTGKYEFTVRHTIFRVLNPDTRAVIDTKADDYVYARYGGAWSFSEFIGIKPNYGTSIRPLEFGKSYIIQVINVYSNYDMTYYKPLKYFISQPYEQLVTFDTVDSDCNTLQTPAYKGEVRISREDKMAYIKLPQFKSFVGSTTLREARFWLYGGRYNRQGHYTTVSMFYYYSIPIDKIPLAESNSETTEEYAIPLSDEVLYKYKFGYDSTAGWDELDYILPVDHCSVRYYDTRGYQIDINLNVGNLQCVDPDRYGESLTGP